jgi:hypothetical protein
MLFIDSDIAFNYKMIERMINYDKEITLVPYPVKTWDDDKVKERNRKRKSN